VTYKSGAVMPKWYADAFSLSPEERSRVRSKTFPGIAEAMASQWGHKYTVQVEIPYSPEVKHGDSYLYN